MSMRTEIYVYINFFIYSPQSLPYKGPSNSAEWRGWFSGLVVRHLTDNQGTRVRLPAEHFFTFSFVVSVSVPITHY